MTAPSPQEITFRLVPDTSAGGFLRKCYDEWVDDAAYYKAHPEIECDPDYLTIIPFEEFVANIAADRLDEMKSMFNTNDGFTVEVVE